MRSLICSVALLLIAGAGQSQTLPRGHAAFPPDRAVLDRLNLKTDWLAYIPIEGRQDGIARVQVAEDSQVFVQTRAGLIVAIDAFTGRTLWKFKMPAAYSSHFPVGFNERYVIAFNVAKLFIIDRYKGSLELEFNLPKSPGSGPVVDAENFYFALTASAVQGYALPRDLVVTPAGLENKPGNMVGNGAGDRAKSPAEALAERFATRMHPPRQELPSDRITVPDAYLNGGGHLSGNQRTPSLTTLRTVVPPYTLGSMNKTESLIMLPSVHKPYTLHPDHLKYTQQTPSVLMLPSVARLSELSNLRSTPLKPESLWIYATAQKPAGEPVLVRTPDNHGVNLWQMQGGTSFVVLASPGQTQAEGRFEMAPVSALAGPYAYTKDQLLGFVALSDGRVMAVDMLQSRGDAPRYEWKAKVGGYLNHKPMGANDGVYASGENSGVVRIDVKTGEVNWRTEDGADTLLAMNDEHVYIRDRRGQLQVYEKGKVHDRATMKARPLTAMSMESFNVPVENETTDRLFLAAESGLIVCTRDTAAKYARPRAIGPAPTLPPEPKAPAAVPPVDPAAPPAEPKIN